MKKLFIYSLSLGLTLSAFGQTSPTWSSLPVPNCNVDLIYFSTPLVGWVQDHATRKLFSTEDGGYTWSEGTKILADIPGRTSDELLMNEVFTTTGNTIWTKANKGYISKSTDNGTTWSLDSLINPWSANVALNFIHFKNESLGFAGSTRHLFKTTDGGATWTNFDVLSNGSAFPWYCMSFPSDNVGYIGSFGKILKTTNGGTTWANVTGEVINTGLNACHFFDENVGVFVGNNGIITRTTDGGATFNVVTSGTNNTLNDLKFINETVGYAIGNSGTVIKTTDAGLTWTTETTNTTGNLTSFSIISESCIYVADGTEVLKYAALSAAGIKTLTKESMIQLAPNPTNGKVQLKFEQNEENAVIVVTNAAGQIVKKIENVCGTTADFSIEGANGIYFVAVKSEKNSYPIQQIVKQ